MPNGQPIKPDIEVLRAFRDVKPFGTPSRYEALGITWCQISVILNKRRWHRWIEYSWTPWNGTLTEEGIAELNRLETLQNITTPNPHHQ